MRIYTLTLSCAFDVYCTAESLAIGRENTAWVSGRFAGGKGINISRALASLGVPSVAVIAAGEENAEEFFSQITDENITVQRINVPGRIRENFTFHTSDGTETRISFTSPKADDSLTDQLADHLDALALGDVLTVTGRVPSGVNMEKLKSLLASLRERGVRLVIDSRSFTREDIIALRPFLIKPNEEELSTYLTCDHSNPASISEAAQRLATLGVENVMISLGDRGAILVTADEVYTAAAPKLDKIVSTVGAGDSAIAGFIVADSLGYDKQHALALAVASGSAACLSVGTEPPKKNKIEEFFRLITM